MPHPSASLIEIQNLNRAQIDSLFLSAIEFSKNKTSESSVSRNVSPKTVALLFFEASTRTRFSFETAAARLGLHPLLLDGAQGTSLEKGESIEDTVFNIAAMDPSALIIRCGDAVDLHDLQAKVKMPILNAGWGMKGHPSQSLLDALILTTNGRDLSSEKLLVIGDVRHSRVMSSHFQLAKILGYEIAICGPEDFLPKDFSGRHFKNLDSGLQWATSVMALRVQHERHGKKYSVATYRDEFGLNFEKMKSWQSNGVILHPGPVNYGVELDPDINQDPRCRILEQVRWGTYLRQALLAKVLSEGAKS